MKYRFLNNDLDLCLYRGQDLYLVYFDSTAIYLLNKDNVVYRIVPDTFQMNLYTKDQYPISKHLLPSSAQSKNEN